MPFAPAPPASSPSGTNATPTTDGSATSTVGEGSIDFIDPGKSSCSRPGERRHRATAFARRDRSSEAARSPESHGRVSSNVDEGSIDFIDPGRSWCSLPRERPHRATASARRDRSSTPAARSEASLERRRRIDFIDPGKSSCSRPGERPHRATASARRDRSSTRPCDQKRPSNVGADRLHRHPATTRARRDRSS